MAQARAELEKANARFLLAIRAKLTPEQWKQMQAFRANMGQSTRAGSGTDMVPMGMDKAVLDGMVDGMGMDPTVSTIIMRPRLRPTAPRLQLRQQAVPRRKRRRQPLPVRETSSKKILSKTVRTVRKMRLQARPVAAGSNSPAAVFFAPVGGLQGAFPAREKCLQGPLNWAFGRTLLSRRDTKRWSATVQRLHRFRTVGESIAGQYESGRDRVSGNGSKNVTKVIFSRTDERVWMQKRPSEGFGRPGRSESFKHRAGRDSRHPKGVPSMALGVLNNLSAIYAENNLNNTNTSLQTVLQQLSSGSRINSGADDAAGLSLVNGLEANQTALTQSETNATEGVGLLQVADGALSQVTSLLDRAITLATEASNGTLNTTQEAAANQEYQSILAEINNIGSTTTYNQEQVFNGDDVAIYTGDSSPAGSSIDDLNIRTLSESSVGDTGGVMAYSSGANNVFLNLSTSAANAQASDTLSGGRAAARRSMSNYLVKGADGDAEHGDHLDHGGRWHQLLQHRQWLDRRNQQRRPRPDRQFYHASRGWRYRRRNGNRHSDLRRAAFCRR